MASSLDPQLNLPDEAETLETLFVGQGKDDEYEKRCQRISTLDNPKPLLVKTPSTQPDLVDEIVPAAKTGWIYKAWRSNLDKSPVSHDVTELDKAATPRTEAALTTGSASASYQELLRKMEKQVQRLQKMENQVQQSGSIPIAESLSSHAVKEDHFANVSSTLKFLIGEVELNIDKLSRIGADAFRSRNMTKVQDSCHKAQEESELKQTVKTLYENWTDMHELRNAVRDLVRNGEATPFVISSVSMRRPIGVPAALDTAIEALELTIDLLGRVGAQAFESRDYDNVEKYQKLSIQIIEFRSRIGKLGEHWNSLNYEQQIVRESSLKTPTQPLKAFKPFKR
jgi:hypothetical protein